MWERKKELLHAHHLNKGDLSINSLGERGTNLESSTLRSADDDLLGGLLLAGRDGSLLRGLGRGGDVGSADVDRLDLRGVLDVRLRLRDCGDTSVVGASATCTVGSRRKPDENISCSRLAART